MATVAQNISSTANTTRNSSTFSADVTNETVRRDSWGVEFVSGLALTGLGVAIVFWPISTFLALAYLTGSFVLVLGIIDIFRGIFSIGENWSWIGSILLGILSVIVGVVVLRYPGMSALTYLYFLGLYLLAWGFIKLLLPQPTSEMRALGIIGGIFTMLLGIVLLSNPLTGGLVFYWIAGLFALIAGPIQIALSFRVKHAAQDIVPSHKHLATAR